MTTTKKELYGILLNLRETYRCKVEESELASVLDITGTGYTNHQADDATMVYDQTVTASTLKALKARLRQIEETIAHYENGTYGICESCEREIDIARLEAIPYTRLCMRCAERRDYDAGM